MTESGKSSGQAAPELQDSRLICVLSVEFRREGDEVVAHCPELRLTDHGTSEDQAEARLRSAIGGLFRICAQQGTLMSVLRERGILETGRQPARSIQVPVPLVALAQVGTPHH